PGPCGFARRGPAGLRGVARRTVHPGSPAAPGLRDIGRRGARPARTRRQLRTLAQYTPDRLSVPYGRLLLGCCKVRTLVAVPCPDGIAPLARSHALSLAVHLYYHGILCG